MSLSVILSFDSRSAQLEYVGGKGLNLCKLTQAGFNVPDAFLITTQVYQLFLETHQLTGKIHNRVSEIHPDDP